jgi:SEL1 protein
MQLQRRTTRGNLLILIVFLAVLSICHVSSTASATSSESFIVVHTPQEAYDRALDLLRSTIVSPATSARHTSSSRRNGKEVAANGDGPLSFSEVIQTYWEYLLSWSPLRSYLRTYHRLVDLVQSHTPFKGSAKKLAASLKKKKNSWEGSSLITTSQSFALGKDPVEEEQARKYPGARREQIWPEWDGGDDVFFGPFQSTVVDESQLIIKGISKVEETFNSMVGSRVQAIKGRASLATGSVKKKRATDRRIEADQKRAEAIALLTWAAGWGDSSAVQDEASLLALPTSIDWSQEAAKEVLVGSQSSESYLADFFTSKEGIITASNNSRPNADALWVLGTHSLWGTHGTTPKPARAKACFERLVGLNGNASAHNRLAWLQGGAWEKEGWGLMGVEDAGIDYDREDRQARALLHYTAAAQAGETSAQNTLAYRYHAGIGVAQNCGASLYWYEKVARDAHQRFISGPAGGLALPYTHLRLSDISGGVYGPGSSAASTGLAKHRPAIQAALHSLPSDGSSDGRRLEDLLEFFTYHADRGSPTFALRLAKVYYGGSVLGNSESAARVQRDYQKARLYLLKITHEVWPTDSVMVRRGGPIGLTAKAGQKGEDIKLQVDDNTAAQAGIAAGMIGKMWLRGEGVSRNYARAWVWFSRGRDQGDAESQNGLGVMYRDGLDIPKDMKKAADYFEAAATGHSTEGCINLAKIYYDMHDLNNAAKWFDMALKIGNSFEAYYYLALINVRTARYPRDPLTGHYNVGPAGTASYERCRNAVSGFKYIAERGDWKDATFTRAEKAWNKGFKAKALLGWALAGEKGFEAAQNNVAWVLDRDKKRLQLDYIDAPESNRTDRLALIHWIRSAAQDNVDALVKMGDYYFHGLGLGEQTSSDHWHTTPTSSRGPTPSATASFDKAAACYSSAAEKQTSALAYWNMGFLYEKGLGVSKKDYNLAKRYYDMALELNPQEAYLPVFLSLMKLFAMAIWDGFAHKDASALSLLNNVAFGGGGVQSNLLGSNQAGSYTEADENKLKKEAEELALEEARTADFYNDEGLADPNLPETYSDPGNLRARMTPTNEEEKRKQEEAEEEESIDDTIEGLMMVIGLAALSWLVYARQGVQMRLERMRRENQGEGAAAAAEQNNDNNGAQQPPIVDPNQPFGWPLQDGNAYAGL